MLTLGISPCRAISDFNSTDAASYLSRATAMYANGNFEGCLDQVSEAIKLNPTPSQTEEALFLQALAYLKSGDKTALINLEKFLESYPASQHYTEVKASIGDYWFAHRNYTKALESYQKVSNNFFNSSLNDEIVYREAYSALMLSEIKIAQNDFKTLLKSREYRNAALFYLGYLDYQEGNYNSAADYFRQTNPQKEPATASEYYLSQIYFLQGNYSRAFEAAKAALTRNMQPEFRAEAYRIAGESLYGLGEESKATPYLQSYVDLVDDPLPSALYILGLDAFQDGNYETAISYLQGATLPDDAMGQSAWLYLGQSYVKTGNINSASMAFEKAAYQNFDKEVTETAFYDYAVARLEGGRIPFGSSVELFEQFLSQYPESKYAPKVQEYIINGYLVDNNYEGALESIAKMRNPSRASIDAKQRALFMLATQQYSSGKIADAKKNFISARSINSNNDIALQTDLWLGDCHLSEGQYNDAIKSYESYIRHAGRLSPNFALALYDLGYAYFSKSDYKEAAKRFIQAIDVTAYPLRSEMKSDAYNRIGDCLYYQHKFDEAATQYHRAYDINPKSGDYALYQLAVMKGLARDHQGKISSLSALMNEFPSSALAPAALLEIAESYNALGSQDQAMSVYQQLINKYPNTAYARKGLLQMAIAQSSYGSHNRAIEYYKSIVSTYPTSEEARIAIDDLKRIYAEDGNLAEFSAFIKSVPNAPQIDPSDLESLAYDSAEREYFDIGKIDKLKAYISDYPQGIFRAQALFYLAESEYNKDNLENAYQYISEIAIRYPDSDITEDALRIKAEIELAEGKNEIAFDTYKLLESKASTPQYLSEARMGILHTAQILDNHTEAISVADKLLATSTGGTKSDEIRYLKAVSLRALNKYDEADETWRLLAKDTSKEYGAMSAIQLAQLQLDRNQLSDAKSTIDCFLDSNTPYQYWQARGFIVLSDILRKQGNIFEADEYLKSLRSNYPGSEPDIFRMIDERLKN